MRGRLEQTGRKIIRSFMPDQHRELFCKLPFLLVGSLDGERRPWASILVGAPGFVSSPDPRTLVISARPGFGDALGQNLTVGAPLGLLGIQLETRRRNRMNGTVVELDEDRFAVQVGQSFGNCPQYIQARDPVFVAEPSRVIEPRPVRKEGPLLSGASAGLIERADTFFIASASPAARGGEPVDGVDVSHRGGKPGFVRVTEEAGRTVLTAPDFSGNLQFNTLGNLVLHPRAGLLFVDFTSGGLLSLTGETEIVWDGPEVEAFTGAERLLRFRVTEGTWIENGVPLRWSAPRPAPQLSNTGSWEEAGRHQGSAGAVFPVPP
ncbi:pyridoxamine 5'-phosphate oxidase family protein [Vitiosangium sp. GDMCC 1.1324]|uniref:pyridoxamine 5'-phosphate oxidase family protein n=1 Tax=Vitiosangium sp. (strain GDMCC 1.1324) TaxID=2138576 RepID=UPI000D3BD024|nr:pyridoxamine 5'-phosphate oxidase family protein [Vitiosangium sp. GDMCC 1.1324]PTL76767.1 flavin-nucleotide-binding protein [Vitiosangium sp. GDMCC 1.1324]